MWQTGHMEGSDEDKRVVRGPHEEPLAAKAGRFLETQGKVKKNIEHKGTKKKHEQTHTNTLLFEPETDQKK